MDSSLDIQAIQLPPLQYQHERRSHDWTMDDTSSYSGMTDVTDFTDSGTLISEDCSNIKLNTGVREESFCVWVQTGSELNVNIEGCLYTSSLSVINMVY